MVDTLEEANYYLQSLKVLMFYGGYIVSDIDHSWLCLDHNRGEEIRLAVSDYKTIFTLDALETLEGNKYGGGCNHVIDIINTCLGEPLVMQYGDEVW